MVLVVTSVISAGYYLPVIMAMYMKPARQRGGAPGESGSGRPPLVPSRVSVVAVLLFGLWPGGVLDAGGRSASTLTQTAAPVAGQRLNSPR